MQLTSAPACVVVYSSKYGASEKYARIIADELTADIYDTRNDHLDEIFERYGTIIWGGGIYAGRINGLGALIKQLDKSQDRRIVVFSVGNTPEESVDILDKVRKNSIPQRLHPQVLFHHFVAKANFSSLTFSHRILFAALRIGLLIKPKKSRTPGEELFLAEYGTDTQEINKNAARKFAASLKNSSGNSATINTGYPGS